ncbi:unnamed protein product [Owenia fusiformis]|uniref:AB hydrolase-1 domain-containing protein n=1 Tax=Owenia fusiformis TaxID=6347 RepID=A0A8S4PBA7_OWEFU|nr:unnamed protein product [Owenia fusiformis]
MVRQRGTAASKHEAREVDKNIEEEVKVKTANKHLSRIPTKPGVSLRQRCFTFAKYALLLSILPPFLNFAALHKEGQQLKPQTGELYDIGFGQKMYLGCLGQGAPTVILDAPTGMSSDVWLQVQLKLAKYTKVCVYDRAGLGFSERPYRNESAQEGTDNDNPTQLFSKGSERWQHYTVERMADDLHRLVTGSSDQPRPFILVGAEMGALVSRFYANMFQGEVSDLVLIEPLVETIFMEDDGIWTQFWFGHLIPWQQSLQLAAATGLTRFALLLGLMEQPLAGANQTMEQIARQITRYYSPYRVTNK